MDFPPAFPSPNPATLDGIATRFIPVDGVDVHVAHVPTSLLPADGQPIGQPPAHEVPTRTRAGVVLLHHFYGNVATWRRVLRGLDTAGIAAIALDRPGFGWSQRLSPARARQHDPNPYTRAFAVQAASKAIAAAGFDPVVVVGSSMGGTIAIELADDLTSQAGGPDLAHLVLLSPAITGDVGAPTRLRSLLRADWLNRAMRPMVDRLSRRMDLERVAGGWRDPSLADQSDIDAYAIPSRLPGWAQGMWQLLTVEPPPDLRATIRALDVATTVVAGRHDRTIRPHWNRRTAHAMDARLVVVDTGHTPQEEAPAIIVDLVADLVAKVTPDRQR